MLQVQRELWLVEQYANDFFIESAWLPKEVYNLICQVLIEIRRERIDYVIISLELNGLSDILHEKNMMFTYARGKNKCPRNTSTILGDKGSKILTHRSMKYDLVDCFYDTDPIQQSECKKIKKVAKMIYSSHLLFIPTNNCPCGPCADKKYEYQCIIKNLKPNTFTMESDKLRSTILKTNIDCSHPSATIRRPSGNVRQLPPTIIFL